MAGGPQQPELSRSGRTPLDPDSASADLEAQRRPASGGATGPVPEDNRPGHHPDQEQDKPSGDVFLQRMRGDDRAEPAGEDAGRAAPGPSAEGEQPSTAVPPTPAPAAPGRRLSEHLAHLAGMGPRMTGGVLRAIRRRL